MSYIVLARRWRPRKFADLVGQDVVARTLQNAVASGQVAHAYLLTGIRGVGKTTIARLMAMAVNCEKGPAKEPCGECGACTSVMNGANLDVQEMDAASHTGVDDIRDILDAVRYPPASLAYKVYIIDEAHMLSKNAFNALLKTLEEPPERVIFILATTEVEKLPLTVRSRCQRFDLRRMTVDEVTGYLREVLGKDKVEYEDEALRIIARAADGSMRDALSLAERVLAFSGKRLGAKETQETLGLVKPELLRAFSDAVFDGDAKLAVEQLRQAVQYGQSPRGLLIAAGEVWHQLACCLVDEALLNSEPNAGQLAWLKAWAPRWDMQALDLRYQVLIAGLRDMAWMDEGRGSEMLAMRLASLHRLQPPAEGETPVEVKERPADKAQSAESKPIVTKAGESESRALAAEPVATYVSQEAAQSTTPDEAEDDELPFDGVAPGFQYGDWAEAVHAYGQIRPNIAAQFEHSVCLEFGHKVRLAVAELHEETIPVTERLAFAEWLGREVHWESSAGQSGESLSQAKQREAAQLRQHMRESAEADPHVKLLREELGAELVNVYPAGVGHDGND